MSESLNVNTMADLMAKGEKPEAAAPAPEEVVEEEKPSYAESHASPAAKKILEEKDHLFKFQAFAYQITSENDLAYNNIIIKYTPEMRDEAYVRTPQ